MKESTQLKDAFEKELLQNIKKAETLGIYQKKLLQNIEKYGALSTAQTLLKRNQVSEGYLALAEIKRLDLSLEATVALGKFSHLFTDEEVNTCFDVLCADGFYK